MTQAFFRLGCKFIREGQNVVVKGLWIYPNGIVTLTLQRSFVTAGV